MRILKKKLSNWGKNCKISRQGLPLKRKIWRQTIRNRWMACFSMAIDVVWRNMRLQMIFLASLLMMIKTSFWVALPKVTNMLQEVVPLASEFDLFCISLFWPIVAWTFIIVNTLNTILSFFFNMTTLISFKCVCFSCLSLLHYFYKQLLLIVLLSVVYIPWAEQGYAI